MTCGDHCKKAASRLRKQEEAARRKHQERWRAFLAATRRSLERLEALACARLAEQLVLLDMSQAELARRSRTSISTVAHALRRAPITAPGRARIVAAINARREEL